MPRNCLRVLIASAGPPNAYAALILFWPVARDVGRPCRAGSRASRCRRRRSAEQDRVRAARAGAWRPAPSCPWSAASDPRTRTVVGATSGAAAAVELGLRRVGDPVLLELRAEQEEDERERDPGRRSRRATHLRNGRQVTTALRAGPAAPARLRRTGAAARPAQGVRVVAPRGEPARPRAVDGVLRAAAAGSGGGGSQASGGYGAGHGRRVRHRRRPRGDEAPRRRRRRGPRGPPRAQRSSQDLGTGPSCSACSRSGARRRRRPPRDGRASASASPRSSMRGRRRRRLPAPAARRRAVPR